MDLTEEEHKSSSLDLMRRVKKHICWGRKHTEVKEKEGKLCFQLGVKMSAYMRQCSISVLTFLDPNLLKDGCRNEKSGKSVVFY